MYSSVIQLCIYMYLSFLKFFPHLGYYRILSSVPCVMLMSDVICYRGFICHLHTFCCSVAKSRPALHNPMNCSTLGFPVPHHLLEFAQVHIDWISDAIQPPHPLLPSSHFTFNLSQHQGFSNESIFALGGQSIGVSALASVLPKNIQDWFL